MRYQWPYQLYSSGDCLVSGIPNGATDSAASSQAPLLPALSDSCLLNGGKVGHPVVSVKGGGSVVGGDAPSSKGEASVNTGLVTNSILFC